jgi:AraC-like DNA-binding protein
MEAYQPSGFAEGFLVERYRARGGGADQEVAHYHDYYEVYLSLGDGVTFFIDRKVHTVRHHDILVIPPFTAHRAAYRPTALRDRILVLFTEAAVAPVFGPEGMARLHACVDRTQFSLPEDVAGPLAASLLARIPPPAPAGTSADALRPLKMKLGTLAFLLDLLDLHETGRLVVDETEPTVREKRIAEVIRHIHRHHRERLTLEDLSRACYMDKFYLCHAFKEVTGIGVNAYVNQIRLAEAEKLLRGTDDSVERIAETVGFGSASRFIERFREKHGRTPARFRGAL